MKYICFGYLDTEKWEKLSESEQGAMMDACFTYDEELRRNGHWAGGEGLQPNHTTLRYQNGRVAVTDGPFVETKELLGGLLMLEASDLNEAIQLLSNHPGMKMGPWEIRPAANMEPVIEESRRRRAASKQ